MGKSKALRFLNKKQKARKRPRLRSLAEGPRGRAVLTHTLVRGPRRQGAPVEAFLTELTVRPRRVVQATQAVARQGVTVAHSVGVHVPVALAPPTGLRVPREPQRVPKEAIITDLTAPP